MLDKKPLSLIKFVVESLEVVLDEKLLLGEKTICGGGKSRWMKNLRVRLGLVLRVLKWSWMNSCLGRNNPWGRKILLDEKPPSSTGFVVESFEVVLDEKLLLGSKQSLWDENPVG